MLVLLVAGFAHAGEPSAPPVPAAPPLVLDPVVVRALSAHDGVECAALPVAGADDLARYTAPDLAPATVPVRAAECLVARYPSAVVGVATPWMEDPARAGLALVVLAAMDAIPETEARALGESALRSPTLGARCGRILKRSVHPAVRALVVPPVAPTATDVPAR
jgi:hypothetical protein